MTGKIFFSNRNKCNGGGIKVEKSHKSLESCKGVTESVNFCEEILWLICSRVFQTVQLSSNDLKSSLKFEFLITRGIGFWMLGLSTNWYMVLYSLVSWINHKWTTF